MADDPCEGGSSSSACATGAPTIKNAQHSRNDAGEAAGANDTSPRLDSNEEAMASAIRDMETPPGMRRCKVPKKWVNRSILYDKGVRFEQDCDKPDPKKQKWFCMASGTCRAESLKAQASGGVYIEQTGTGNATRHLFTVHGLVATKTMTARVAKSTHSSSKRAVYASGDPVRAMALLYVKVFVVSHLLAFGLSDSKDVRMFFDACSVDEFPQDKLYPEMIQHYVVELYAATSSGYRDALHRAVKGSGGPVLHGSFDLWTNKGSNEKYIGLRVFWTSHDFIILSALLAVKLFQPSAALSDGERLSDVLLIWVEEVLAEYGVAASDLFSTVTDAGSGAKRLSLKVVSSSWEWSFPHMLNCALVEAFGTSPSRKASRDAAACALVDLVKEVTEHVNDSSNMEVKFEDVQHIPCGTSAKLADAVPRRWISTCNALEQVLRNWAALEKHYMTNETVTYPLAQYKTEIEEMYSFMKPVAALIKESEESGAPTSLSCFFGLVALRCTVLDDKKPLMVQSPRKAPETSGATATTATTTGPEPRAIERPAANLTRMTTNTRKKLAGAIDKRFFDSRYKEGVGTNPGPDYVHEMAACMNPFCVGLQWLEVLCSSAAEADRVRTIVYRKVVDLMTRMAEACGEDETASGEGAGSGNTTTVAVKSEGGPAKKRKHARGPVGADCVSVKKANESTQWLIASGMFGSSSASASRCEGTPRKQTARQTCELEFNRFREEYIGAALVDYPVGNMLWFWKTEGKPDFPNMARAARVLLSVPASSTVVERDLSAAGHLKAGCSSSSRLDASYAEMVLFLNGSRDSIPSGVPTLSPEKAHEAVPRRMSNPKEAVRELSTGEEGQIGAGGVDEYAAEQGIWGGALEEIEAQGVE